MQKTKPVEVVVNIIIAISIILSSGRLFASGSVVVLQSTWQKCVCPVLPGVLTEHRFGISGHILLNYTEIHPKYEAFASVSETWIPHIWLERSISLHSGASTLTSFLP